MEVPTDVLERRYEPSFRVVAEPVTVERKVRLDPIVPASAWQRARTAGTIGVIVYDRADGTPYVLSNWHVLHGARGDLGDDVVQPGPHDDNRVERNRLGRLSASTWESPGTAPSRASRTASSTPCILELGVVPRSWATGAGRAVVKSGRTTGVTHGIVRRVDTIAKLN